MQYIFILSLLSVSFFKIKDIFFILEKFHILPDSIRNYLYWDIYSKPMPIYHPVVLKQIAICLFFLFIKKKYLLESNKKTIFLFKIYFVSTLYYLFFLDFEILAGRFGSLFYGVETIFLLQIIYSGNFKQKILMKLAVFALICLSFFSNLATLPSTLSFKATFQ
ncbi:hypothetical protein FACS1894142_1630 [Spirochaetia bacterium]|nr:hypothetical protein FACS1894142_1630 [Spirochaetia bacterium]